jgi:hypothetical protein
MRKRAPQHYVCPTCEKKYFEGYHNLGAKTLYSDNLGKNECYMFDGPLISKCEQCNTFFWINKLKEVEAPAIKTISTSKKKQPFFSIHTLKSIYNYFKISSKSEQESKEEREKRINILIKEMNVEYDRKKKLEPVEFMSLNVSDLYLALKNGLASNIDEELYIRIKIWTLQNDIIRYEERIDENFKMSKRWSENIKRLIKIIDHNDEENIFTIAEFYRNLGEFDLCKKTLEKINDPNMKGMQRLKELLLNQCELKYRWVIENNSVVYFD